MGLSLGVNPVHYTEFQTPSFTKCALTGPKSPGGLAQHRVQLYLPCQFLVCNKSKVCDLSSQMQCLPIEGKFFQAP